MVKNIQVFYLGTPCRLVKIRLRFGETSCIFLDCLDPEMPKKISTQELEGTRRRGRPRKGWKEEVERDLQVLGVGGR